MQKQGVFLIVCLSVLLGWSLWAYGTDRGTIQSGETRSGFQILVPSAMDTWKFQGTAGDRILFNAETTEGSLYPYIQLYPPGGGAREAVAYESLSHQLAQTGEYTVMVSDNGNDDTGSYNVSFLKIPGTVSSAGDPDGGPIASGQTIAGSSITPISDMDAFQFYGTAGDRVVFNAETTSGSLYPYIQLYPPGGGAREAQGYQSLSSQLAESGLYTLVVSDNDNDHTGTYHVSFLKIPGTVSSPDDPNGGAIASGQTIVGSSITPISDMDAFQFYGTAGDRVVFNAETTSGSLYPYIQLYPPGGGAREAQGYQSLSSQLAKSGLYTLVVSDNDNDHTGTYNVSFSKNPSTVRPGIYNPLPANGASVGTLSGSFSWNAVSGATGYDLYFGENVTIALQKIGTNLTSPSRAFPALQSGKVYYWHVVAHTAAGDVQGPYWWFTTSISYNYLLWTR